MKLVKESHGNYTIGVVQSTIFQGDAEKLLSRLPSDFFRCCVTSPPYWGLRDYQTEDQIGAEDDPGQYVNRLVVVFEQVRRVLKENGTFWLNIGDSYTSGNRGYRGIGLRIKKIPTCWDITDYCRVSLKNNSMETVMKLLLLNLWKKRDGFPLKTNLS